MFVVAQHTASDWATMIERGQALFSPPPGITLHAFLPSTDQTRATCLWEGPSRAAIQDLLDRTLGDSARNLCYDVDTTQATGLPGVPASGAIRPTA